MKKTKKNLIHKKKYQKPDLKVKKLRISAKFNDDINSMLLSKATE
jgi:hypothetical protein